MNLLKIVERKMPELSKRQKRIAQYLIDHYDKAAFMTASKLGEAAGVSESTVVRFATALGFDGYPELQKMLQELIKSKLTSVQRMEVSTNIIDESNVLKSILQSDIIKIKETLQSIDQENFKNVVKAILNAKRIYIIGVRSSASLAVFLSFYFNLIFDNVKLLHAASESEMLEQILRASSDDVLLGITFPRYSKRTVKAMQFAKNKGAVCIAITDSGKSPIVPFADLVLFARSDMASFADSLVAPLSVINALIVAVGMSRKEQLYETLTNLEAIWDEYNVYEKTDNISND
ncbi:MAG TPA: MurR/RpiR family transcriptional regulator [Clostridiaceae bacterium]|nr:MurR/RpiR family transcriptional regulator [Clostridiaceae bacterium]